MIKFYYQIKGRRPATDAYGTEGWAWPPVFSGMVEAEDRKSARASVEELYERKFPMSVKLKDIAAHDYLLHIEAVDDRNTYMLKRFEPTTCKECGTVFRLIDKYNDPHTETKSHDYCKESCQAAAKFRDVQEFRLVNEGRSPAVIYQVRQKSTGMSYVGQTTQPFTLRWWQHLSNPSGCKFHAALTSTDITDWEFSVLEVIDYPADCSDRAGYISRRERHWIDLLSAVDAGFNTVRPATAAMIAEIQAVLL
uniref:GIY-YIG domain-containing protein n=1 Tax=Pseudomonas phage Touem01 TaxID=3138548 RepID=A0AAU6W377_9VIRU